MAKEKKGGSAKLFGPLYESGKTNGPVAGPKGGKAPRDPFSYLSNHGDSAPSGGSSKDASP
jgi:hypothetical protein